jgi:hypothetical protein
MLAVNFGSHEWAVSGFYEHVLDLISRKPSGFTYERFLSSMLTHTVVCDVNISSLGSCNMYQIVKV